MKNKIVTWICIIILPFINSCNKENSSDEITSVCFTVDNSYVYAYIDDEASYDIKTSLNHAQTVDANSQDHTYHFSSIVTGSFGTVTSFIATVDGTEFNYPDNKCPVANNDPMEDTKEATNITENSATLNGIVNANGGNYEVTFIYGITELYGGLTITASPDKIEGNSDIEVSATVSDLNPNTTYYFRVKVSNDYAGFISYYSSFTTGKGDTNDHNTVTDIDGNIYHTVKIGNQEWLQENLRTTRYSNGDSIAHITDSILWSKLKNGAYCWYNNNETTYKNTFGALYNWYAINDERNVCPSGYHIPNSEEWNALTQYLGGDIVDTYGTKIAGGHLKESGTTHWQSPNTDADNVSKFTALPGGCRNSVNSFVSGEFVGWKYNDIGKNAYFWTKYGHYYDTLKEQTKCLSFDNASVNDNDDYKTVGSSVRCISD